MGVDRDRVYRSKNDNSGYVNTGKMNLGEENIKLLLKVVGGTVIVSVVGYVIWRRCRKPERLVNKPIIFLFNEISIQIV